MKISIQTGTLFQDLGVRDACRAFREAGFEAVDWNVDTDWSFAKIRSAEKLEGLTVFERSTDELLAYYREQLEAIRENGLVITQTHAPFPCYVAGRRDILDYSIGIYQNIILLCEAVGCKNLIIHGICKSVNDEDMSVEEYEALNMHLYESLIPTLQKTDVTVCLENIYTGITAHRSYDFWTGACADPYVARQWIDRLNEKAGKRCFGLCLDVGHLNLMRQPMYSYIPILGDRICALHLHDNCQTYDSHLMPYAGSIQWEDFLREMKKVGYAGDLSFETFGQTQKRHLPKELVPAFLYTIAEIGRYFRKSLSK